MKKTLLLLVMLTMVGGAVSARRLNTSPALSKMAVVRSGSIVKVFYRGESASKVTVKIYNANGQQVLNDNIGKIDNFVRPYNFSDLAEGEYKIELEDASGKQVEQVVYRQGKVGCLAKLSKVSGENSKYVLMVPSHAGEVLQVKILNSASEVVYQAEEKSTGNFAKVYDLKALSSDFSFQITDKNGSTTTLSY